MKKIFGVLLLSILFMTGCGNSLNTPTGAVEEYLKKYQNVDTEVINQLDQVINSDVTMSEEQKKDYKELMLNQYKNISYKIVNENNMGDEAEVEVEVEVLDYASSIGESRLYYRNHQDEFKKDEKENNNDNDEIVDGVVGDAIDTLSSFIDYKIKNMKSVTNTSKNTITFFLNKIDNEWVVEDLSDTDIQKLHGLYEG